MVFLYVNLTVPVFQEMLKDVVRTKTYQNVIYQNKFLFQSKIVLDMGAGTGILSLFCAKAGAANVYAVSVSLLLFPSISVLCVVNYLTDQHNS